MLRLQEKNGEVISSTTLISNDNTVKDADGCDPNVLALTHTNASGKSELSFSLELESETQYMLEVTVVRQRTVWYYSKFEFTPPTTAPKTSSPTASKTTSPSSPLVITESPSASPTTNSLGQPSSQPTQSNMSYKSSAHGSVLVASSIISFMFAMIFV